MPRGRVDCPRHARRRTSATRSSSPPITARASASTTGGATASSTRSRSTSPLLVRLPRPAPGAGAGGSSARPVAAGRRVTTEVRSIDLVPTVLDVAGIPPESWPASLDGESLRPLLEGAGDERDRPAYADSINRVTYNTSPAFQDVKDDFLFALIRPPWKYIHHLLRPDESRALRSRVGPGGDEEPPAREAGPGPAVRDRATAAPGPAPPAPDAGGPGSAQAPGVPGLRPVARGAAGAPPERWGRGAQPAPGARDGLEAFGAAPASRPEGGGSVIRT